MGLSKRSTVRGGDGLLRHGRMAKERSIPGDLTVPYGPKGRLFIVWPMSIFG